MMNEEEVKYHVPNPARHWLVALVGSRAEKAVRDRLLGQGLEAYVATQNVVRVRKSGRRVKIESVVITQYVFVHVTEEERKEIIKYPYIHSFLMDKASGTDSLGRHKYAVIPDKEMEMLKKMLCQEDASVKFATSGFSLGDEVSVLGWGDDVKGHIVRIRGEQAHYIGIRIEQLGCAYIEVPPNRLLKVGTRK